MIWNNERIHVTVKGIPEKKSSQTKYLKTDNELGLALNVNKVLFSQIMPTNF